jgi:hypothetical protein
VTEFLEIYFSPAYSSLIDTATAAAFDPKTFQKLAMKKLKELSLPSNLMKLQTKKY